MNSSRIVIIPRLKCQYALLFTDSWKKNRWFHAFLKDIRRWPGLSTGRIECELWCHRSRWTTNNDITQVRQEVS